MLKPDFGFQTLHDLRSTLHLLTHGAEHFCATLALAIVLSG